MVEEQQAEAPAVPGMAPHPSAPHCPQFAAQHYYNASHFTGGGAARVGGTRTEVSARARSDHRRYHN